MPVEIVRLAEAAERLGITTKETVYLVHERKIRYVRRKGRRSRTSPLLAAPDHGVGRAMTAGIVRVCLR